MSDNISITLVSLGSSAILACTQIYNVISFVQIVADYINEKWRQSKSDLYILGLVAFVVAALVGGAVSYIAFVSTYYSNDTVIVVVTSLSVLLSFYISYYHRFAKHLWMKRFLYS